MATSSRPPTGTNGFRTPRATRRYLANFDAPSFQRATLARWSHRDAPLYYASAALKDGRVFVAGGECNVVSQVDLLTTQIYHPSRIRGRFCLLRQRGTTLAMPQLCLARWQSSSRRHQFEARRHSRPDHQNLVRVAARTTTAPKKAGYSPQSLGPLRGSRQSSQG